MPESPKLFGTEGQCHEAPILTRWPEGISSPSCANQGHRRLRRCRLFQHNHCKKQVSLTVGTIFHSTVLPQTTLFWAKYSIAMAKNGILSMEAGQCQGIGQRSVRCLGYKILGTMARMEEKLPLLGVKEMDDAYLGEVCSGGKSGRDAPDTTPLVAMVSTIWEGTSKQLKKVLDNGFRKRMIVRRVVKWLDRNAAVVTDTHGCGILLDGTMFRGMAMRTSSGRRVVHVVEPNWSNMALDNIKRAISDIFRELNPGNENWFLASFVWGINRRRAPMGMVPGLVPAAAAMRTRLIPHRVLTAA